MIAAVKTKLLSRGQWPPQSGPSNSVPPKPEVDALGKLRPITSGSEVSDDDEQDLLNQNLPRSDLKRVKRYTALKIQSVEWAILEDSNWFRLGF